MFFLDEFAAGVGASSPDATVRGVDSLALRTTPFSEANRRI